MKDWSFLDALRKETEQSLAHEPERKPWGRKVEEVIAEEPTITPHRGGHGTHGRPGKGGQTERHAWSQAEYDTAKRDLERQAADYAREQQREHDEARRSLRDVARERRQAARDHRDDDDKGMFW